MPQVVQLISGFWFCAIWFYRHDSQQRWLDLVEIDGLLTCRIFIGRHDASERTTRMLADNKNPPPVHTGSVDAAPKTMNQKIVWYCAGYSAPFVLCANHCRSCRPPRQARRQSGFR